MSDNYISLNGIKNLLKDKIEKGTEVFGPIMKDGSPSISKIINTDEITTDYFITVNSIKEAFFPRYEPILKYTISQSDTKLSDIELDKEIIILGGHPCDAASIILMEKLFGWDYKDNFYLKRKEKSIIITFACEEFDKDCFCTSLGYSPRGEAGSDILLEKVNSDSWSLKGITEKGKSFIEENKKYLDDKATLDKKYPMLKENDIAKKFDKDLIKKWIENNFEDPLWKSLSINCWSCAACTYVCPTCHCFDMTDDASLWNGIRTKNWDACTLPTFTLHASGHNPRESYYQRYRQRISHKYSYYVDLFSAVSCTGCGRCSRVCSSGINIAEILTKISETASNTTSKVGV